MCLTDTPEDYLFATWQRQLARGKLNDTDQEVVLPSSLLCPSNSLNELISHTYPDLESAHDDKYFWRDAFSRHGTKMFAPSMRPYLLRFEGPFASYGLWIKHSIWKIILM